MQDNAPIHTARKVLDWFIENGIPLTDWPPYSPDLNPIEHVWWHLKKYVYEHYPELLNSGKSEQAIQDLENALVDAWNQLPEKLFESLIKSMPHRIDACILAKGWHTRY